MSYGHFEMFYITWLSRANLFIAPTCAESRPEVSAGAVPVAVGGGGSRAAAVYRGEDVAYHSPVNYPPHERNVEVRQQRGRLRDELFMMGG